MTDEQLERVKLMAAGSPTWDLSDNDLAALSALLTQVTELTKENNALKIAKRRIEESLARTRENYNNALLKAAELADERDALKVRVESKYGTDCLDNYALSTKGQN
jgi:hypothetical protein